MPAISPTPLLRRTPPSIHRQRRTSTRTAASPHQPPAALAAYETWQRTPITDEIYLSVLIPAFNEEQRIIPTIGAIAAYVCELGRPWELLVVDDGSTDRTAELVEGLGLANLRLLRADQNGGKGSAVRRGLVAARGRYVLFTDADNSTPIEELDRLLDQLERGGFDLAVGSRAAEGAVEQHRSALRQLMSTGLRWIVRHFLKIGIRDTQCGFKLFSAPVARRLAAAQTITGFAFDLELLYLAGRFGYRIAEVPVKWIDAPGSKVNPAREIRRFLLSLGRIKLNALRGRYPR